MDKKHAMVEEAKKKVTKPKVCTVHPSSTVDLTSSMQLEPTPHDSPAVIPASGDEDQFIDWSTYIYYTSPSAYKR